jgi:hypothetical protein
VHDGAPQRPWRRSGSALRQLGLALMHRIQAELRIDTAGR